MPPSAYSVIKQALLHRCVGASSRMSSPSPNYDPPEDGRGDPPAAAEGSDEDGNFTVARAPITVIPLCSVSASCMISDLLSALIRHSMLPFAAKLCSDRPLCYDRLRSLLLRSDRNSSWRKFPFSSRRSTMALLPWVCRPAPSQKGFHPGPSTCTKSSRCHRHRPLSAG